MLSRAEMSRWLENVCQDAFDRGMNRDDILACFLEKTKELINERLFNLSPKPEIKEEVRNEP